ncbi:MAG: tRNA pseudouridine(38-40) synthase TruA, partial [Rubripirellula sp.]
MRTFKLTVAYEGTRYFGWQVQPNQPTVQAQLQKAIQEVVSQPISVVGSGRTDSGVHALGQVVSCCLPWKSSESSLGLALNTKLPPDITVCESVEVVDGFHAIHDAVRKCYRYQLQTMGHSSPFERRYRWRLRKHLDLDLMQEAANLLVGEKDFAAFQAAGSERKSTVRNVLSCSVFRQAGSDYGDADRIAIEIEANGFL